ncbi:hypothetical protein ACIRQP_32440 [Streptomyces sp. NPDC102274]
MTLGVSGPGEDTGGAAGDLRRWLRRHPELRDRISREPAADPAPGSCA